MVQDNNPFMRYEFLSGLESSGCVTGNKGWQPTHIAVYSNSSKESLVGAMPGYIKSHSYGEYIFDWAWADAYHRHGLEYYPKYSNAVPFTPATGERFLVARQTSTKDVAKLIFKRIHTLVDEQNLSSFHSLFCTHEQSKQFAKADFSIRDSTQFHWQNKGYQSFSDFLAQMSSKKRKNIKRERRRVQDAGIRYQWLTGEQLDKSACELMHKFYQRTITWYGAQSYLNRSFFDYLAEKFSQHTLFLFAQHEDRTIAGGLYFKSNDTLYGRYWGALENFHSVHFETCYYQAIEWCISKGYQRFEAGAQGEHKLARGLEPNTTYSAHWIRHPQFRGAIDEFLSSERDHTERYQRVMTSHSPFKVEI